MSAVATAATQSSLLSRVRHWHPQLSSESLIVIASMFFALACNTLFWRSAMATHPGSMMLALSLFALLVSVHAVLLGVLLWRWNAKVLLTLLLLATAFATHYMNSYNVYLDADMLRNVLATDQKESRELLTPALILPLLVYALLPILLLWRVQLVPLRWNRALLRRLLFLVATVVMGVVAAISSFQDISALLRNHREVRYLATPINYMVALKQNLPHTNPINHAPKRVIGSDAMRCWRPAPETANRACW